jgi:cell division protein FtsW (lipid II flippase)
MNLQPSEFAKATLALVLASSSATRRRGTIARGTFMIAAAITAGAAAVDTPAAGPLAQPVTLVPVLFRSRVCGRHVDAHLGILAGCRSVGGAESPGSFALQDYQKERISTFVQPVAGRARRRVSADSGPLSRSGSGGPFGKGSRAGTQEPAAASSRWHTMTSSSRHWAEEQGFLGVVVALGLYLFVILRIARGGQAGEGSAWRIPGAGSAGQLYVPGAVQHYDVGRPGAGQGFDASAHELWRFFDDRDARGIRPDSQCADAQVYQLMFMELIR